MRCFVLVRSSGYNVLAIMLRFPCSLTTTTLLLLRLRPSHTDGEALRTNHLHRNTYRVFDRASSESYNMKPFPSPKPRNAFPVRFRATGLHLPDVAVSCEYCNLDPRDWRMFQMAICGLQDGESRVQLKITRLRLCRAHVALRSRS